MDWGVAGVMQLSNQAPARVSPSEERPRRDAESAGPQDLRCPAWQVLRSQVSPRAATAGQFAALTSAVLATDLVWQDHDASRNDQVIRPQRTPHHLGVPLELPWRGCHYA
jgi:hypothetical protein